MKSRYFYLLVLALSGTGCSTPTALNVIPLAGNQYRAVGIDESEKSALGSALNAAETTCRHRDMRHVVIKVDTRYRGMPRADLSSATQLDELSAYVHAPAFPSLNPRDDYQISLLFRCEGGNLRDDVNHPS